MRISRTFRKYNRVLLLVFMSLLLVVFLVGPAVSRGLRNRSMNDPEVGTAFGKAVYLSQTLRAADDFETAARFGLSTPLYRVQDPQKRNLAMCLLLEEAKHAGVRVGRDQIVASLQNNPNAVQMLTAIRRATSRSLNSIYDAIARINSVMILAQYQIRAASGASLPQLEDEYRDQNQEARVLISVIDSSAFSSQVPEPSEEELQANFEQGKDRETERTDEAIKYGYRIPDRVQVEYLTVDPGEIRESIRVSEKNARRYYEDNRQKYVKTVEDASPLALEEPQTQTVQLTYDEVSDQVREDYRAEKAILEAQRLVNEIHQEAVRPWAATPLDKDGERQRPSDQNIVPFTELQKKFSAEYPVKYKETELVTLRELKREPGFGRATAVIGRDAISAPDLAFHVKGLATADPNDPKPLLRIDEPGPVVLEGGGAGQPAYQAYVFRVVAVAPAGPPKSLDDVRAEVVRNVEKSEAFELAGEQAQALAEKARQVGLKQAVAQATELKALLSEAPDNITMLPTTVPASGRFVKQLEPYEPETFSREAKPLSGVGFAPGLHEKVFDSFTEAGETPPGQHHVVVVPLARTGKWAVVELLKLKPIYRGEFEMARSELEQQTSYSEGAEVYGAWFEPDNVIKRTGFVPTSQPVEE
jgi:hypothetical protein